jgi:hypothetical protein
MLRLGFANDVVDVVEPGVTRILYVLWALDVKRNMPENVAKVMQ